MTTMKCTIAAIFLFVAACGTEETGPQIVTGEEFSVHGSAALTDCATCPEDGDDGLSYQTPRAARLGVAEVWLLRAIDDPAPHLVYSNAPALDADLMAGATFCAVDTGSIPEGVYTHMQVKLDWLIVDVEATGHTMGYGVPGTLEIDYTLSDYTSGSAGPRSQGDYVATFSAFGTEMAHTGQSPVDYYPPSYPDGVVVAADGEYHITFASPETIIIDHEAPESVDVDVTYFMENAFGWLDIDHTGHNIDVFDLEQDPSVTEVPARMAVWGFEMSVREPAGMPE